MFKRLRTRLVGWAERYQQREIERIHKEYCRLKEEAKKLNGTELPIPLSQEQRRLLAENAKGIDPEVLKRVSVFGLQDVNPEYPNDPSAESP